MQIRPFRIHDEDAVIELWKKCGLMRPQNDPRKDIQRKLRVRPDLFLVGVLDGKIIASVMAGYEGHRGWINYLAVAPEHQKHGYARAIMAEAERLLLEAGCPKINLQVRSTNKAVIECYKQLGYAVDDVLSMGKRLEIDDKSLLPASNKKVLVLDAMGVMYAHADDIADLLFPFVAERGGMRDEERILDLYHEANIGKMSSADFWRAMGLDPSVEDEYIQTYTASAGLAEFLKAVKPHVSSIWVLSNDISEWSLKLRERFGITKYAEGFIISGDVGVRKPDPEIFKIFIAKSGLDPKQMIFADDRPRNLEAAVKFGIQPVLFTLNVPGQTSPYPQAADFDALLKIVLAQ